MGCKDRKTEINKSIFYMQIESKPVKIAYGLMPAMPQTLPGLKNN